jgi:DeoR family fructose operon transcriptional repressor
MIRAKRKKYILDFLDKNEYINIQNIVENLNISKITARRDLNDLHNQGLLVRTHGGAIRYEASDVMFEFNNKAVNNCDAKLEICRHASKYIEEGETIYMDCGSTVFYLSRFLSRFRRLRVITNSLPVISELMPFPHLKIYLIGGELDNSRRAFYGTMTEDLLYRYKADKAFIGAGGISLAHGLSSVDEKGASITKKMAESARQVFLLCDSSKIEKDSYFTYSSLSLVDCLITNNAIDPRTLELYRQKINIITV